MMATYSNKAVNNRIIIVVDVSIPGLEAVRPVRVTSHCLILGRKRRAFRPKL